MLHKPSIRYLAFLCATLLIISGGCAPNRVDWRPSKIVLSDRVSGWRVELDAQESGESPEAALRWRFSAPLSGRGERRLQAVITNLSDQRRCISLEYEFQFEGTAFESYFAGAHARPAWPENGELAFAYVREDANWIRLGVPYAALFDSTGDQSICFTPDLADQPILPFEVRMRRESDQTIVVIRRPAVRLEPRGAPEAPGSPGFPGSPGAGDTNSVDLFVAQRGGDWREGLAWMRDRWRDLFIVRDGLAKFQWCHWGGTDFTEEAYANVHREIPLRRGIFQTRPRPWFGLSCSDEDRWLITVDQKWYLLKDMPNLPGHPGKDADFDRIVAFVQTFEPDDALMARLQSMRKAYQFWRWKWLTHEQVRDHCRHLVNEGYSWHYYWNPSETWAPWAKKHFPDSLYVPLKTDFWTDSTVLDPLPGSRRARQLVEDARRIFDKYPECDGLFMDQVYYDLDNHKDGFDDGVSIDADGKPFSRHQWNTWRVIKKIREIADQRGKTLHANFIFNSLEIASLTDFGLVEGISPLQKVSWFYDIGNRVHICQHHDERANQECAVLGWQNNLFNNPVAPSDDRGSRHWLNRLMRPIFMMFQERHVVLEPRCLQLPAGFKGSVFRRPDGNVLVTIVTPGASQRSPYEWADLDVTVRTHDASKVKRVYQLSSDRLGAVSLDFERRGRELRVRIPRHRSISMLVLATTGRFTALRQQSVCPEGGVIELLHDDLDRGTRTVERIRVGAIERGTEFTSIELWPHAENVIPNPLWEVDGTPDYELRVEPELAVTLAPEPSMVRQVNFRHTGMLLPGSLSIPTDLEVSVQVTLHNRGSQPHRADLKVAGESLVVDPASAQVTVPASGRASVMITIRGVAAGPATLSVSAGDERAALELEVTGARLKAVDLKTVKHVALIVDSIATGAIDEKIHLNGNEVGTLKQGVGTPVWDFRARHLLGEEARQALRATGNVIEVSTGERKFVVREPVLEVAVEDGRRYLLRSHDPTQSTPPNWLHAQGRRIDSNGRMRWEFR